MVKSKGLDSLEDGFNHNRPFASFVEFCGKLFYIQIDVIVQLL
jgi:hypothetical protein